MLNVYGIKMCKHELETPSISATEVVDACGLLFWAVSVIQGVDLQFIQFREVIFCKSFFTILIELI